MYVPTGYNATYQASSQTVSDHQFANWTNYGAASRQPRIEGPSLISPCINNLALFPTSSCLLVRPWTTHCTCHRMREYLRYDSYRPYMLQPTRHESPHDAAIDDPTPRRVNFRARLQERIRDF